MLLTCALALAVCLPAPLHPNSVSRSVITVRGAAVRHELHCQAASLMEVLPDLDGDRDGLLSDAELAAGAEDIEAYVAAHYVLRADTGGPSVTKGHVLTPHLVSTVANEPEYGPFGADQWIDLVFEARHDALVADLMIEVTIFREVAPDHRDLCDLVWNDDSPWETVFWLSEYRRWFRPESPPVARALSDWVVMGVQHILHGWDHLAFVLALIAAAGGASSVLGVVTAFTLAHSITLALAATGTIALPSGPVEAGIALSIAWVGFATLLERAPRARWREAFVFGLVHGLGFASFLGAALYGEPRRLVPLFGFNLGVEAGQLLVVLAAIAAIVPLRGVLLRRAPPSEARFLVPTIVRIPLAAVVTLAGAWWLIHRVAALWPR